MVPHPLEQRGLELARRDFVKGEAQENRPPPGGRVIVSRKEKLREEYSEEIVTKRDRAGSP
jgi:hypothetical protein